MTDRQSEQIITDYEGHLKWQVLVWLTLIHCDKWLGTFLAMLVEWLRNILATIERSKNIHSPLRMNPN